MVKDSKGIFLKIYKKDIWGRGIWTDISKFRKDVKALVSDVNTK